MKREQLQEIKQRVEKVMLGPWEHRDLQIVSAYPTPINLIHASTIDGHPAEYEFKSEYDAEFIAHARQDVPVLIAEIERLRKALHAILDAEETNLEGYETVTFQLAREALGLSWEDVADRESEKDV